MKIIEPNAMYYYNKGVDTAEPLIALGARVCYASKKSDGIEQLIKFLIERGHYSPFAHGIIYYNLSDVEKLDKSTWIYKVISYALQSVYSPKYYYYDTLVGVINCRTLIESIVANQKILDMPEPYTAFRNLLKETKNCTMSMWEDAPFRFKTVIIDTSLAIERELERHIGYLFYLNEQSTRYCNFSNNKFGNSVSYCKPSWFDTASITKISEFKYECEQNEQIYFQRLNNGWSLDEARKCLSLETATRMMITASMISWEHFFDLRVNQSTGKVDPDMLQIATMTKDVIKKYD